MKKSNSLIGLIVKVLIFVILLGVAFGVGYKYSNINAEKNNTETEAIVNKDDNSAIEKIEEKITNGLSKFDLSFIKLENKKENMIYSPLSIKYALKMLEDGAGGESKAQISNWIGDYTPTLYKSGKHMSLANAMFIRDTFKDGVKDNYIETIKEKYDAEIKFDAFKNADNLNSWVKEKTLEIIPNIVDDKDIKDIDYALVNALAIDMEWKDKFLHPDLGNAMELRHVKDPDRDNDYTYFMSLDYALSVSSMKFEGNNISGMNIESIINNYDILTEVGEENIKKKIEEEYRKFAKEEAYDKEHVIGDFPISDDTSDSGIEKDLKTYIPEYIKELKNDYQKIGTTTDYSFYVDDDVKVFAKDLDEYDGTTLQYVGIMPVKESLDKYIENIEAKDIEKYISELRDVNNISDFKERTLTKITGFIPKFNFEYSLDLKEDLKKNNITDVFEDGKANLENMIEGEGCISSAIHKANIEFTQDGIKAAAATEIGGWGAGEPFNYVFDVPMEKIDLTFDKPYMFLIRDKKTNETWFVGNVYEPLDWEEDDTRDMTME